MNLTHTVIPLEPSKNTLELLSTLIGFNTVSRESNLGLIEWVRDHLQSIGAKTRLTYDAQKKKANLFATVGEGGSFGTVFSGHTDVVPVDGQAWESDPFIARVSNGKVFGRGACDMKGFIAVCLARIGNFTPSDLHIPLHFAFSYDEEVGCLGVRELLADLKLHNIVPAGCIVGEPTMMNPVIAHKGKQAYRCSVHGQAAHSSSPQLGINAIDFSAELIVRIREIAERQRDVEVNDYDFDVPFSSIVTTVITGGNAVNTIPEKCEFVFEHRFLPGVDPRNVLEELRSYAENELLPKMVLGESRGKINFEVLSSYPGLNANLNDGIVASAMKILGNDRARKVGFGTEAGLFNASGIPTIICGPGDIAQAHKPNEFITLDQLARCENFFDNFVNASNIRKS
jgi:acetylornithine deacetylase